MFYLVYKVTNKVNGKIYIGVHKTKDKNDSYLGSGTVIKLAVKKYGIDNFQKEIIYEAKTAEEMFEKENELVEIGPHSYNLKEGGRGLGDGFYSGSATKARLEKLKDPIFHKRFCENVSNGLKKRYDKDLDLKNKLIERAKEYREKFGSYKLTKEDKIKISLANKENHLGDKNSMFGKMWITNGTENKTINKTDSIPNGYIKGRKL